MMKCDKKKYLLAAAVLPCYGLFVRHVRGLTLDNVQFSTIGVEPRNEAVMMVDVTCTAANHHR